MADTGITEAMVRARAGNRYLRLFKAARHGRDPVEYVLIRPGNSRRNPQIWLVRPRTSPRSTMFCRPGLVGWR
jgi:hypothetical protein